MSEQNKRDWEFEDRFENKKRKNFEEDFELSDEDEEILEQYNFDPRKLK